LAKEDGVTVFLTTQYLEEADVLSDRIAIIDRGRIVAEGTPAVLKSQIGRPTVEALPTNGFERERVVSVLARFGEPVPCADDAVAVRLRSDETGLADLVRALDAEEIKIENLQLHQPTLDDVFLAKTGRSLEGAGQEERAVAAVAE
jgi:ABC-2 type transport system ATP-binding protein